MKYKIIMQHDRNDCGAACLATILNFYGSKITLVKARELTFTDTNGASVYSMVEAAKHTGFISQALSGTKEELLNAVKDKDVTLPFIAHIISQENLSHYVVVFEIKKSKIIIGDPSLGIQKLNYDDFFNLWLGNVITLTPGKEYVPINSSNNSCNRIINLIKSLKKAILSFIICSILVVLISTASTFIFKIIIDDILGHLPSYNITSEIHIHENSNEQCDVIHTEYLDNYELHDDELVINKNEVSSFGKVMRDVFLIITLVYFVKMCIELLRMKLYIKISRTMDDELLSDYYTHLINLPINFFKDRKTGEIISRFIESISIREAIISTISIISIDLIMIITASILLFNLSSTLFYVSMIIFLINVALIFGFIKPLEKINNQVMTNNSEVVSYFKECTTGIETVKAYNQENIIKDRMKFRINKLLNSIYTSIGISSFQNILSDFIVAVGTIYILWVGVLQVIDNTITLGTLITFNTLLVYFIEPIKNILELQPTIQKAKIATNRISDIFESEIEVKNNCLNKRLSLKNNSIKFTDVDFRYGNKDKLLSNINISINAGEKIAIVGKSGCGKTTLIKLLMRFYQVEKGTISIGNSNINEIPLNNLRDYIAYVSQDTFLFADSVLNNLTMGNSEITIDDCKLVAKQLKIDDFIESLQFKYDTVLDENGSEISGGERQKLALVRALLKKPQILILDEFTSNLDIISESLITESLDSIASDITCVFIAHNLNIAHKCDRIFVMENGKIIESGAPEDLLKSKGYYYNMYNKNI